MAPTLGKRKRITREELNQPSRSPTPSDSLESDSEDMQTIFRRAFEAKFKPLEVEPLKSEIAKVEIEEDESEEVSDWSGLSSTYEDQVEVVDYADSQQNSEKASKAEIKAFMSSKPPSSLPSTLSKSLVKPKQTDDDPLEASHLKNDLELQNLLRESHILSLATPTFSTRTTNTQPSRHKITDLHVQSLGAKSSVYAQKSMPMSHRKGINAKTKSRDDKRRSEARENGIVLEREKREKKTVGRRERGVGGPSVGKFRSGTLTLSKKDVASITGGVGRGPKGKNGKKKKR